MIVVSFGLVMAEKFMLRVVKVGDQGGFVPADAHTQKRLRERGYTTNDLLAAELRKPRNPRFHRFAHALGLIVVENIEGFENFTSHKALKRLQLEARIECDEIAHKVPGCGMVVSYIPRSLSFESMDEGRFREVICTICSYIVSEYWKTETPETITNIVDQRIRAA